MSKKSAQKPAPKAANDQEDQKTAIVKTALDLSAEIGWENVQLYTIADEANMTLVELHQHFDSRFCILSAFGRMIDQTVLKNMATTQESSLSSRDVLFDLIMERFDALNDYRDGVMSILRSFRFDPKQALISLPHLGQSMTWMLEAARIHTSGYRGALKVIGLTGVYLKTLKTWMDDESPDMSKTMAELDKNLSRAENYAGMLGL